MTVQAVCFDLDDTLFDYHEYARAGLQSAADRLETLVGADHHAALQAMYFQEGITERTFDRFLARQDLPAHLTDELVKAFHEAETDLPPYPDTRPVLADLASQYRLGLVTDGRGGHAKLQRLGLEGYFDAVVVAPTIGTSKTTAEPFQTALSGLSVSPADAAHVGDHPRFDVAVPNELGMTTIRLRRGRYADREATCAIATPDYEVHRLRAVSECL
ncbi:MAG: HAD family hydrolase [Halorhabdus sp.]